MAWAAKGCSQSCTKDPKLIWRTIIFRMNSYCNCFSSVFCHIKERKIHASQSEKTFSATGVPQFARTEALLRSQRGLPGGALALTAGGFNISTFVKCERVFELILYYSSSMALNYVWEWRAILRKVKPPKLCSTPSCGGASPVCPDGSPLNTEGRRPCTGGRWVAFSLSFCLCKISLFSSPGRLELLI